MKKHKKKKTNDKDYSPDFHPSPIEEVEKTNNKSQRPRATVALKWCAAGVVALLITSLFVVPPMIGNNTSKETGNKYTDATAILQHYVKDKLPNDWFQSLAPEDPALLPPKKYLCADLKNKAIILIDGTRKDSIFYSKNSKNRYRISLDAKSQSSMERLRGLFDIDGVNGLDTMCSFINADSTCLSYIKRHGSLNDKLLSLIYNTIVGDTVCHLYVAIEKKALSLVRYRSRNNYHLNINNLMVAAQAVNDNPEKYKGLSLDNVFDQYNVLDSVQIPPFASLDYRNDCIRIADGTDISGEAYSRWRDTLINNPSQLYLFVDGRLMASNAENIKSYGTVNASVLGNCILSVPVRLGWLIPVLLLIFGLIEGALVYSLLFGKKTNASDRLVPATAVSNITNDEITRIKDIINDNTTMKREELDILAEQFDKLVRESGEYERSRADVEKMGIITNLLSGNFTINELMNKIVDLWKNNVDGVKDRMEHAKQGYDHNIKQGSLNQYKESHEYKTIKDKSNFYDALIGCGKEDRLIELLGQMRNVSNGKMAEITTLSSLKEKNPTVKDIVQVYDTQTKSNLSGKYDEMERNARWYDENMNSVVQPVEKARKNVAAATDRKQFVRSVFEDVLRPLFGKENENKVAEFLKGYLTAEDEARVYHLMMESRDEFDMEGLEKGLSDVVKTEDANWLARMREAARRYTSINKFNDKMWDNFVQEFVEKERYVDSDSDRGWFFGKVLEIAYHTADHIRSIKEPADEIYCHNAKLMGKGLDVKDGFKEFDANNPMRNTAHAKKVFEWANELGVDQMKIVVDEYAIMP